jgi:ABC-type multidrug transport system fused ATPase/permease subunit
VGGDNREVTGPMNSDPLAAATSAPHPGNVALIWRLLALAWRYPMECGRVLALQIILLVMGLAGVNFIGFGIDYLRSVLQPGVPTPIWFFGLAPSPDTSPHAVLTVIGSAILAFALLRAGLNYVYALAIARLVHARVLLQLRTELYEKIQRLSFRFFDTHGSSGLINRVIGDVQALRGFVEVAMAQGIILVLSLAVYLAYMVHLSVQLTMVCLASTPILVGLSVSFSRRVRPQYVRNRDLMDRLFLQLGESLQGVHTIKGFARESLQAEKFQRANDAVRDQQESIFRRVSRFSPTIGFISQLNIFLLLGYGGWLVVHDRLPLGSGLVVFATLLQQFAQQVGKVADIANTVQQSLTSAQRVFEILDAPVEIQSAANARKLGRVRGQIELDHVTFGYKPGEPVLRDITLRVEPGQCVAILGVTGSGKSSLLSLIPRFYDPQDGRVRIDGHDVRDLDLHDLRRQIGLVFQESFLFSHSIGANIAFGHPQATREQMQRAARTAAAHDFIMDFPAGYDTVLGELGAGLSGGQRQRLAIARALLLDPPILLMDDPTASIDPETEREIFTAMHRAIAGRTTLIVAHRLSTLQRADLVVVLDRGRIVQSGHHETLLRMKGPYRRAARIQLTELPPILAG